MHLFKVHAIFCTHNKQVFSTRISLITRVELLESASSCFNVQITLVVARSVFSSDIKTCTAVRYDGFLTVMRRQCVFCKPISIDQRSYITSCRAVVFKSYELNIMHRHRIYYARMKKLC